MGIRKIWLWIFLLFCFLLFLFYSYFLIFILFYFLTLQYCIGFAIYQHEPATGIRVFPILNLRKMVTITLCTRQQKRHWCIEQSYGLCGRGKGWEDLGEWHWNMYNIIFEMSRQSRFDTRYWMLGACALGRPRGMVWGTHVYLWQIHFDIWQNQYNIVKLNKIK